MYTTPVSMGCNLSVKWWQGKINSTRNKTNSIPSPSHPAPSLTYSIPSPSCRPTPLHPTPAPAIPRPTSRRTVASFWATRASLIAKWPSWRHAYMQRLTRMVQRDKNRPSVVVWSLGNESRRVGTALRTTSWPTGAVAMTLDAPCSTSHVAAAVRLTSSAQCTMRTFWSRRRIS